MEEKEKVNKDESIRFSFKDLFINLKKKWVVTLIVGLVTLIVSCTGLIFISKEDNTYYSKFDMYWPRYSNNQYPNGGQFNYEKLTSLENLKLVQSSDDKFKDINVNEMFFKNDINIKIVTDKVKDGEEGITRSYYKITAKQKYFHSREQAGLFLKALIEDQTFDKALFEISDYKILNYFDAQRENTEYPEMINNISNQISLQQGILNNLIEQSSGRFVYDTKTGRTLGELSLEYNSFLTYDDYHRFEYEMKNNKYVRHLDTYKEEFKIRKSTIELEMEKNNRKIQSLKDLGSNQQGQDSVPQMIANLTLRNEDLKWELEYINEALISAKSNPEFQSKIEDYQNRVAKFNTELEKAYRVVNESKTFLKYEGNAVIHDVSDSFFKVLILSLIFTIGIEFILSLILTYSINRKKQLA